MTKDATSPSNEINLKRHNFLSSLNFYIRNSMREMCRRKLYYFLAVFSVLIVVTAIAISQTVIEYSPLILLKSTESDTGSIDISIAPPVVSFTEYDGIASHSISKELPLNFTRIESLTDPMFPGLGTPRNTFLGTVNKQNCQNCLQYSMELILQNTLREREIGLGINLPLPDEIPIGSVALSSRLASLMDVKQGDQVTLIFDIEDLLENVVISYNFQQPTNSTRIPSNLFYSQITAIMSVTVNTIPDNLIGKVPDSDFGITILMEYKYFFSFLSQNLPPDVLAINNSDKFAQFISTERAENYAEEVIYNLPDRVSVYSSSNFDSIQGIVTSQASKIADALGVFPFKMDLPVYNNLAQLRFGGLFLGITLNIIIIVLFVLSVILVYNLLMVTIETKTFEMGVLRMLGLNKIGLIEMIMIQALSFVLPAILLGELLALPFLSLISGILENLLNATIPATPSGGALAYSIGVGFLIPLISSYYPMREALSKNLNISLDLVHSKTSSVQVLVELDSKKFPWTEVTFSILTVVFGISVYILIPLSLLSFNISLLLAIFFGVLLGLLFGLVLISINFQHLMERAVTKFFFFWTSPTFQTVIVKNLVAHKLRNRKTAIMYALSLGFVLFLSVSLNQQLDNLSYSVKQQRGALLRVRDVSNGLMDQVAIEKHIQDNLQGIVESYTWITQSLEDFLLANGVQGVQVSHLGRLYSNRAKIVGIMPNFFKTAVDGFLITNDVDTSTGLDLAEQLYTPRGSQGAIIGTFYRDNLGLGRNLEDPLVIEIQNGTKSRNEVLRVLGVVNAAPGLRFSNIPLVQVQNILVSMPKYISLAAPYIDSPADIPCVALLVKVYGDDPGLLNKAHNSFIDLKTQEFSGLDIFNYLDYSRRLQNNQQAFTMIFIAIEVVVFILALFSLITSMSTNIIEQSKEIAVLRAVGVTKSMMIRIYIAEAFVLVFSSALFGLIIGIVISWTMSLQIVLFTQIPIAFRFPFQDLIVVLVAAIGSAALSTYMPAKKLVQKEIAHIIRAGG